MWQNIDLSNILLTSLASALFTGIFAFSVQRYIERWFQRSFEKFKVDLQKSVFEYQQFQGKKAEVIAETYKKLAIVPRHLRELAVKVEIEPSFSEIAKEKERETQKAITSFSNYFEEHQIYLPKNLCAKIEELNREFKSTLHNFTVMSVYKMVESRSQSENDSESVQTPSDYDNYKEMTINRLIETIVSIQQDIDAEFRKVLGQTE